SLGYGKNDFVQKWGKRPLEDNWRWSKKGRTLPSEATGEAVAANDSLNGEPTEEERLTVDFYMDRIPTEEAVIDSLKTERNFANYQLGLIYKEKFKENLLAAGKLETVLASEPEERLVLPSKYNLYKIYEEEGSPLMAQMKANILQNHPESRYAEILLNPRAVLEDDADSPDARYAALFKLYKQQEFLQTITGAEENIDQFTGDPIVPKFEMLKANAIGRLNGFEPFKEQLDYVALTYPNNPEGKKAEQMIAEQIPKLAVKDFTSETGSTGTGNWKVVFPFRRSNNQIALRVKKDLEEAIKDLKYKNIVSKDIYTLEDQFVVVHGFPSKDYALGFAELIRFNDDYRIENENFVILSSNYKIIQVHKNLQDYKEKILN
ncbi:MAG: hypothetical protein WA913_12155, partial [Pricia sp.]